MVVSSKAAVFLTIFNFIFMLNLNAKEILTYKRFPMIKHGRKFLYPLRIQVSGENLRAKINPKMGTHFLLGIDQLYVSKNLKKKILIKQDVIPNSKKILGRWVKLKSGSVYHFKKHKRIVAVYVEGYHERSLSEIEKQFVSLKKRKVSYQILSPFFNALFSCAHAEVGDSRTAVNSATSSISSSAGNLTEGPQADLKGDEASGEGLARCLARQTGSSLVAMGGSAANTAATAAKSIWNDPMGAARATGNYLYGTGQSAVKGVYQAGSAVVRYCLESCLDASQMFSDAGDAVDSMYQLGAGLANRMTGAVQGFANLEPAVKSRLICEMGGQLIAEFGANAVLSFLGGSALAAPRVALMLTNLEQKISTGMVALTALGKSSISTALQQDYVSRFVRGNMTESEILAIVNPEPSGSNLSARISASADSSLISDLKPSTAVSVAGTSLDTIEQMYDGQLISVKSKSGNTYSGTFKELFKDSSSNEMGLVLTLPDGQLQKLRVRNLDLDSISGSQNGFSIVDGKLIRPIAGTELGAQIESLQARTGISLEMKEGNALGGQGFHLDYEAGTVKVDKSILQNPDLMKSFISQKLPRAITIERQVRSNLRDNHGITVAAGGVIQSDSSTSRLGRMVEGLQRRGITVRITDPSLDTRSSAGLAYGSTDISINSSLMLPGRETDLGSVLRHEIRHTTDKNGVVTHPLVNPANTRLPPTPTSLAYAGRNIQFTSAPGSDNNGFGSSGLSKVYSSRFSSDEYEARLTQSPRVNPSGSYRRGGKNDDSQVFLQNQGLMLYLIQANPRTPAVIRRSGDRTIVSYQVDSDGAKYIVDIPISGPVQGNHQAKRLARQVIDARVNFLSHQHVLRVNEGTFRQQ